MTLIEELYNRNIRFKHESKEYHDDTANLTRLLERNEKVLLEHLDDEGKEIFEKYKYHFEELSESIERNQYVSGFLLGGRILAEILLPTSDVKLQD